MRLQAFATTLAKPNQLPWAAQSQLRCRHRGRGLTQAGRRESCLGRSASTQRALRGYGPSQCAPRSCAHHRASRRSAPKSHPTGLPLSAKTAPRRQSKHQLWCPNPPTQPPKYQSKIRVQPKTHQKWHESRARRLSELPTATIGLIKLVIVDGQHLPLADALDLEEDAVMANLALEDAAEGLQAFLDKRKAVFTGK